MMISHYLPLSISNRTAATIQVKHEPSASSSTAYADLIEPHQTTPTKAIKTDFKLAKLHISISVDLEKPKQINIQLAKRRKQKKQVDSKNNSLTSSTIDDQGVINKTQIKNSNNSMKYKSMGRKIEKIIFNNHISNDGNRKFLRLKVDYFLNSQPFIVKDKEEISGEKQIGIEKSRLSQSEPLLEADPEEDEEDDAEEEEEEEEKSENQLNPSSSTNSNSKKKRTTPQFEIFQSISDDGSVSIMILKKRNFSNWMSHLPDHISISELTIPGTHQSCSRYGWPISQCQTRSLSRQLQDGIRFLDIRLALPSKKGKTRRTKKQESKSKREENGQLIAYHGIQSQIINFFDILKILNDFLISHPTETIIVSIKRENHVDPQAFKDVLLNEFITFYQSEDNFHNQWWLKSFLPDSLDQVRGKLILFSRKLFQAENDDDFGIRFPDWPNNSSEIWETSIPETNVAVQDWCDIGSFLSISKKSTLACVSLCRALHEPLRSSSSPTPPGRSKSPGLTNVLSRLEEEEAEEGPKKIANDDNTSEERNQSLRPGTTENEKTKTWVITFLSAHSLILGFPTVCSRGMGSSKFGMQIEGINSRVARWLISRRDHQLHPNSNLSSMNSSSIKGVVCLMDFYQSPQEALVSLLVDCNFPS